MISVLGTGVAGLCAATALAEAGHEIEVIAPKDALPPVSALAGGMLAPFCEGETAPEIVVTRGQMAAGWWAARVPGVIRRGTLVLAAPRDTRELDRFARATRGHVSSDPGELEPDLTGRFARALFYEAEAHLDPRAALAALSAGLAARGVTFRNGSPRGRIVDCTGLAARADLPDLRAVRGEILELRAPDVTLTRTIRLLHPRFPVYIVPRGADRYMIGATMIESDDPRAVTARGMMELLSAAYTVHPGFAEAEVIRTAVGLRPAFPDNLPSLRVSGDVIHINGMYRHGFLMAPAIAADLVAHLSKEMTHAH